MFPRLFLSSTYLHSRFLTWLYRKTLARSILHPEIKQYTDNIVHSIWDENNKLGTGSYAYFAPGDREKYQPFLGQSYPINNPRVFFAGEHLAINHASVQGAVQTAVSAVIDILEVFT